MGSKSATEMYRELGRRGGSSADFKKLYFKLKGKQGIKDRSIHNMMMSGAMQSELKKGGFPDHSGDGKITQKDILMAKGVIPKTKGKK